MPIDATIPLSYNPQTQMGPLKDMVGTMQSLLDLKKAQATYDADVAQRQAESQSSQYAANVNNQTQQAKIDAANALAQREKLATFRQHISNGASELLSLHGTGATPDQVAGVITNTMKNAGATQEAVNQALQGIPSDPALIDKFIVDKSKSALDLSNHIDKQFAAPSFINTGQQAVPVASGNPAVTNVPAGTQQGVPQQLQLPPTAERFNNETGAKEYIGPQGSGSQPSILTGENTGLSGAAANQGFVGEPKAVLRDIMKIPPGPDRIAALKQLNNQMAGQGTVKQGIQTGPALGQAENVQGTVAEVNKHFASLNDSASGAPLVDALTGNITQLAQRAITGTEADRKSYVVGLLNAMGLGDKVTNDLQKDTDLLQKNMSQMNLSSKASSDAMQTLINSARPNSHMNPSAIPEAAQQIASQVKANMAVRNFLTPYKLSGDYAGYQNTRNKLEAVADPRIWQYMALKPGSPEATKFLSQQGKDAPALFDKLTKLRELGML